MTRLDRTILASFLKNYVLCLVVLLGLYVMMDAFFNFDEISRGGVDLPLAERARGVVAYYTAQSLFIYAQLAGVVPVAAAAFTFLRMTRFNEIVPLLAAGVPLVRVAAPAVVAGILLNLIVQPLNQEVLVPRFSGWLTLDRDEAASGERNAFAVEPIQVGDGNVFLAGKFRPPSLAAGTPATAEQLTVVRRDPMTRRLSLLTADAAAFDSERGLWVLAGGRRVSDLVPDDQTTGVLPTEPEPAATWDTPLRPTDVELAHAADVRVGAGGSYYDLLSTRQMTDLLARPDRTNSPDLLRAKHARLSGHAMNVVLILLAVPAVLTRQPGDLRLAARRTIGWTAAAMVVVFVCHAAAREPPGFLPDAAAARWPATLAWLPVLVFGPIAAVKIDRMET